MEENLVLEDIRILLQLQVELLDGINSFLHENMVTSSTFEAYNDSYYETNGYLYELAVAEYEKQNNNDTSNIESSEQLEQIYTLLNDNLQTSEQNEEVMQTLTTISQNGENASTHLQNLENVQILVMCGVGMLFGAVCTLILSRFLHH